MRYCLFIFVHKSWLHGPWLWFLFSFYLWLIILDLKILFCLCHFTRGYYLLWEYFSLINSHVLVQICQCTEIFGGIGCWKFWCMHPAEKQPGFLLFLVCDSFIFFPFPFLGSRLLFMVCKICSTEKSTKLLLHFQQYDFSQLTLLLKLWRVWSLTCKWLWCRLIVGLVWFYSYLTVPD